MEKIYNIVVLLILIGSGILIGYTYLPGVVTFNPNLFGLLYIPLFACIIAWIIKMCND